VTACDGKGKTALHYCATNSNALMVQLLVSRDRSVLDTPDNSGHTPLHAAVIAGNVDVLESLLSLGANVNAQDSERHTAAHWAVGLYPQHNTEQQQSVTARCSAVHCIARLCCSRSSVRPSITVVYPDVFEGLRSSLPDGKEAVICSNRIVLIFQVK